MKTIWQALLVVLAWLFLVWYMIVSGGVHVAQLLIMAGLLVALVMGCAAVWRRWRAARRPDQKNGPL